LAEEKNNQKIASRGVPSSLSLYFPPYNSEEIRSFQDDTGALTRNLWSLSEIVNFVFSKKYQPKYYEVALGFLTHLSLKLEMHGDEISEFIKSNGISKATFYNRVLPRLRRVGMIKIERHTIVSIESKRKFRPMKITLSKTFGNYLLKIGDSWLAEIDDARTKQRK